MNNTCNSTDVSKLGTSQKVEKTALNTSGADLFNRKDASNTGNRKDTSNRRELATAGTQGA